MDDLGRDPLDEASSGDAAHSRKQNRDSLFLVAQFRLSTRRRDVSQVRIRNLSAGGLMADLPAPLPPGTPVELNVRGIGWIPGQVAWCVEGRVGVAFDHPIDPALARKPVTGGAKTPVFVKPILPIL